LPHVLYHPRYIWVKFGIKPSTSQWRNSLNSYIQKKKMTFFKNGEQEGKTGPIWELAPVGGVDAGKG
jgi:hypothetical protein